jgi:hypothetical protein
MKTYYMNDGEPLADGRVGVIIDFEDGRPGGPQKVYAPDLRALTLKVATMAGNASVRLTEVKRDAAAAGVATTRGKQNDSNSNGNGTRTATETQPRTTGMDPATRMQRTHELNDPAKSGDAVAAFVEERVGMPLDKIRELVERDQERAGQDEETRLRNEREEMFRQFADETPDFPQHPTNRSLLVSQSIIKAGGLKNLTRAILDETFAQLQEDGLLVPAERVRETQAEAQDHTPTGEASRRSAATSYRRQDLTGARAGTQTTRWTDEKLAKTTRNTAEHERLMKTDPTYSPAVNAWVAKLQRRTA